MKDLVHESVCFFLCSITRYDIIDDMRQTSRLSLARYEKWTRVNFLEPNLVNFNLTLQTPTMLHKEVKWDGD